MVIGIMALALAAMVGYGVRNARKQVTARADLAGPAVKGKAAPDFELQDVTTGKKVRLADYKGKAVLLNFWATWCPPCKIEIPWFVDLQKQYGGEGLVVVGVAMDDASQQEIAKFAQDMGINYPILQGSEKVGDAYGGVEALPTTFYIGRDGKIVDRAFGLHSHSEVERSVKAVLNSSPGSSAAQAVGDAENVAETGSPAGTAQASTPGSR
jgi:peroxiredoxin